ncbi:hydroxylase [Rhodococcus sp. 06-621-2]|nr:acyl-CoA dehydrogenase family protein [Rhodococcus sp. 06-621-2]OZC59743.1 hydroxylase [Rhodococcus sp. 06-621-2]
MTESGSVKTHDWTLDPTVTPEILIERAAQMREVLRAEQPTSEAAGKYAPELQQQFLDHGFFHILHPRRYGGYGFGLDTFLKVMIEISRGDPGVGWALTLAAGHAFHVASYFPQQAQEELLGAGEPFIAPFRTPPQGKAEPVDGGYFVSGQWDYCSGSTYANHFMVVAMTPGEQPDEPPHQRLFVIETDAVEVLDDWGGDATLGMQASGSNSVRVTGAFVPRHRSVVYDFRDADWGPEGTPGYQLHKDPLYMGRTLTYFNAELVATQVGAALAALDEYEELMLTKASSFPPRIPRVESAEFQRWFGALRAKARTAEIALLGAIAQYTELGVRWEQTGRQFTVEDDVVLRSIVLEAAQLAVEAVDIAFTTAGSSAAKKGSRLQKYYRDAGMYRTHIASQWDVAYASGARQHFGKPLTF